MIWLNPSALFALAVVAAPVLIHLLVQRHAERLRFPTLRFLQPTRLAAIRRHLLEDLPLVLVRAALVAAAVIAVAGPVIVTPALRESWNRRLATATVTETGAGVQVRPDAAFSTTAAGQGSPLLQTFAGPSLADGIRRALRWLASAPPARREIVIASALPIGSISQADLAMIPPYIGIRFERTGTLPTMRTVPAGRRLIDSGVRGREVTFSATRTSTREFAAPDMVVWPIDVVVSKAGQPAVDAAVAAVLSQGVWETPSDRRARFVVLGTEQEGALAGVLPVSRPWMAAAIASIGRDPELRDAALRVSTGSADRRFGVAPWHIVAFAADGRPLAAAAASTTQLVVATAAPVTELVTPILLRSIANAIAVPPDLRAAEVVPISDSVLQRWSRSPAPITSPRVETIERDDRRWVWIAVLGLLALEAWMRRARQVEAAHRTPEEQARVA